MMLKQFMPQEQTKHILLPLLLWTGMATSLSLWFRPALSVTALLFWGVPAAYLSLRVKRKNVLFAILFSALATFSVGLLIGYLSKANNVWFTQHFLFPFPLYGPVTVDDCIWLSLYIFAVLMAFEATVKHSARSFGNRFYMGLVIVTAIAVVGHAVITLSPPWLSTIPYMYLGFDVLMLGVALALLPRYYPRYRAGIVRAMLYLLPVAFLNEVISLSLGLWYFPSNADLLGRISVFGEGIPFEEAIFFLVTPLVILALYVDFFKDSGNDTPVRR